MSKYTTPADRIAALVREHGSRRKAITPSLSGHQAELSDYPWR